MYVIVSSTKEVSRSYNLWHQDFNGKKINDWNVYMEFLFM